MTLANNITGSGSLTINGDNDISSSSGTITQSAVTNNAELTANAGQITADIVNNDTIKMKGSSDSEAPLTNTSAITGNGTTEFISGYTENKGDIKQETVKIAENASLNNTGAITAAITNEGNLTSNANNIEGNVTNDGSLTLNGGTLSNSVTGTGTTKISDGEVENDSVIAQNVAITNSGTLTSSASAIAGSVDNAGTYNINGGTISNVISGNGTINITDDVTSDAIHTATGDINLAEGKTLSLGANASDLFTTAASFTAGDNSTINLANGNNGDNQVFNNLIIADGNTVNLKIDWNDSISSTDTSNVEGTLSLTDIDLTNATDGDSYTLTNLTNNFDLSGNLNLTTGPNSNMITYKDGVLTSHHYSLVDAIEDVDATTGVGIYAMTSNETAGEQTLQGDLIVQGNGNAITTSGVIIGDNTSTGNTLILRDTNLSDVTVGTTQGAIQVNGGNELDIVAENYDVKISGTNGSTKTAIYLSKDVTDGIAKAVINAQGSTITIEDDILSDSEDNEVLFTGSKDIVFKGNFDPVSATVDMTGILTRSGQDTAIDWTLKNGTLFYTDDSYLSGGTNSMTFSGGALNLMNGAVSTINLTGLTINNNSNLYLDVDLANKQMDNFGSSPVTYNAGTLHIAGLNLISDAVQAQTEINFTTDATLMQNVDYTGATSSLTALSPIYQYAVSYDNQTGNFNFARSGGYSGYNPAVMASPVAAQGSYLTQINTYEQAFANMDMTMLMTQEQRQAMKYANKYADGEADTISFDSTKQIPEQHKSIWFRPFTAFENVKLDNGPEVDNIAYGTLVGGDSKIYELPRGWDMTYSIYTGYNGSHQSFDGVSIYQNGAVLGLNSFFYKNNFFTGITANAGVNIGEASTMYGKENITMLDAGIASKTGYNFELAQGKFIIQPSWLMSYTFVHTFDHNNGAGLKIDSDALHAIQFAPQVKFIGNLKNGWQPYASIAMIWNIMDKTKFTANDVGLPETSVKPYIQYGIGVQKRWKERLTAYGQAMFRNGGRNGVSFQLGLNYALGQDGSASEKKTKSEKVFFDGKRTITELKNMLKNNKKETQETQN